MGGCYSCLHLKNEGGGWEYPQFNYKVCDKRPAYANLKGFPWVNTKCRFQEGRTTKSLDKPGDAR
jgi:hypothetical protein